MFLFHVLSPTSSDLFLAFVRLFLLEDKLMRLFNAHRPSGLGHAVEPVFNNGLPALPIRRAEAACDSMSHRAFAFLQRASALCFNAHRLQETNY